MILPESWRGEDKRKKQSKACLTF
uniref:Uncharacterized protein n=1 Tax=Lepeophtheirus salmonis TaxID=72036 RepID=A0A0K2SX43_LEPSM